MLSKYLCKPRIFSALSALLSDSDKGGLSMAWHDKRVEEVAKELNTDLASGIVDTSAQARAEKYGRNSRTVRKPRTLDPALWRSAMLLPAVVFAAAAVVYIFTADYAAAVSIFLAALVTLGAQASILYRAGKLVDSIERISAPVSTVVRGGMRRVIDTALLVPGDVVILRAGDEIGADMRVVESVELRVDESPLQGGFISARKTVEDEAQEDTAIAAHSNMLYCGCTVSSGYGRAVVVETGEKVAFPPAQAAIPKYAYGSDADTRALVHANRRLSIAGVIACVLALAAGLVGQEMKTENLVSTILLCCTLGAGLIPAALCLAQTAILSRACARLARRGAVVKSLHAMENIDRVSSVVLPKTGVVTADEMTATVLWSGGNTYDISGRGWAPDGEFTDADGHAVDISRRRDAALAMIAASLCGSSDIEEVSAGQWVRRGDPTECALVTMAAKAGLFRADTNEMFPRIAVFPYEPEKRMMSTIHRRGRSAVLYAKGAPELVLACSDQVQVGARTQTLSDANREQITERFTRMTEQGLRVVALAYRELGHVEEGAQFDAGVESSLVFLGLVGIENRVAHGSVAAFNQCESAGIKTLMVSGDEMGTTSDTALSLGIHEAVFDGDEIDRISPKELVNRLRLVRAAARVTPQGKRAIVDAQKQAGLYVAAAGTHPGDAPALRASDIGFALGANSTEALRQSAEVVLDESAFSEIARVIEESRRGFARLCGYTVFAMAVGLAAFLAVLVSYLAHLPLPLSAVHFAWLGAILSLIPALVLDGEPGERSAMRTSPRMEGETPVHLRSALCALCLALVPAGLTLAAAAIAQAYGTGAKLGEPELSAYVRASGFVSFLLMTLALAHTTRSEQTGLLRMGVTTNRRLLIYSGAALLAAILAVYLPFLHTVFDTRALQFTQWLIAVAFAAVTLVWGEVFKGVIRPLLERAIKVTPKSPQRRIRRVEFGEGFFSKFENADPTQEEEPQEKPDEPEPEPEPEIVEVSDKEQTAPEDAQASTGETMIFGAVKPEETPEGDTEAAEEPAPEPEDPQDAASVEEPEPEEASEEPAPEPEPAEEAQPEQEKPKVTQDTLARFMTNVPDELKMYGDVFASLPHEILKSGLDAAETPNGEKTEE